MKQLNLKLITFTLLFGMLINPIFSQKVKNELGKIKLLGSSSVRYEQRIDLDKGDTLTYLYMGYQNSEYTTITDIQSIMFTKKSDVESFITDIKKIVEFMGDKKEISFDIDPAKKNCLLEGLDDIALTLNKSVEIGNFEGSQEKETPWLYGNKLT